MADAPTLCDHCGSLDTHPKSHWNDGQSFHFDCLPYDKAKEFVESHPLGQAHLDAVLTKKGDELRAHLKSLVSTEGEVN